MDDLITSQEIQVFRNPSEFIKWFETYLEKATINRRRYKKEILSRKEIFKVVYEEVFPLYRFLQVFGSEWHHLKFRNVIGDQNYDVEVIGSNDNPFRYIEITVAGMNHEEHLRMEELYKKGRVSLTGKVTWTRTKKSGLNVKVYDNARRHEDLNEEKKAFIRDSIGRKSLKNYPDNTILLMYFDDYVAYSREDDCDDMFAFMESVENTWTNKFKSLYLVGATGRRGWLKLKPESGFSVDTVSRIDTQMNFINKRQRSSEVIEYTRINS